MKKYQYNKTIWRKNGDGTVCLRDARGLIGSDPHVIEVPEAVYENGKVLPVIGLWAAVFQGITTDIRRIVIPKSVTYINIHAFFTYYGYGIFNCLEEIIVDPENTAFAGIGPGLYTKDLKKMLFFPETSTQYAMIPEQTILEDYFFYGRDCSLMPERILKHKKEEKEHKVNQEDAFADYGYETNWYEEQRGGRILEKFQPFADEQGNVDLLQYKGETPIGYIANIMSDWNRVTLPDTIKIISCGAFLEADIKSMNIPKSIEEIGCCAFIPWNGTDILDLPATLQEVEPLAFDGADKIKHLILPQGIKDCRFLFNFTNLETIELKDSVNGKTNFIMEDGVLYSADKSTLVKYLRTKTDKEFRIPKEVKHVIEGAFRNNPYIEKLIIPISNINIVETQCKERTVQLVQMDGDYIDTIKVGWPLNKNCEGLEEVFDCYLDVLEERERKWKNPMFTGCSALKALVYEDGTYVYGDKLDVVTEGVTDLVPPSIFSGVNEWGEAFFLINEVLYSIFDGYRGQTLEYYPVEKKDEVFAINKDTCCINSLESKYIKKLVICNSDNSELFQYSLAETGFGWQYARSNVNLPSLEKIELVGDDGCFFIENDCLFHTDGEYIHFDLAVPGKEEWGMSKDGQRIHQKADAKLVSKIEIQLDGTHFYCPMYDMVIRKNNAGQWFAKFGQRILHPLEDWVDEDTGDIIKIQFLGGESCITTNEIELLPDNCILAEFSKEGGMLPITEYLYHTIGCKWEEARYGIGQYEYDSELHYRTDDAQTISEFEALTTLGYHYSYSGCGPVEASEEDVEKEEAVSFASLNDTEKQYLFWHH